MKDKRKLHLKVQNLCDCFATTEKEDGGQLFTPKFSE